MDAKKPTQSQKSDTDPKSATGNKPNPARFNDYQVLPDQSGFRIPNCDHVFEFDTYGGWFDEYNNYYNADGQPTTPPEYDDEEDLGDFDDIADALAKEYDMDYDDGEEEHLAHYDNIYLNIENKRVLENYLKDQEINAEIRNMNFNSTETEFENFLKNKRIDYIEFEFEYDNRDRFRGVCFITLDKPNAQKLIEFNGSKLGGRDIKINILKPDEEEEADVGAGGDILAATSKKPEEQKTQWRAPVEKPKEESTATTTQANPTTDTELEKNQPKPSGNQQGQSQGRYQNQSQNYQKNQGYNQNQGQRQQNYQQNRGNQQGQYQKQGQSGIQRNYGGPSQNQYQGQSYQQNTHHQQGQNYQNQRFQGGYSGGQNQYQYPQYQNQGGYQQQYYGAPQNQYQGQGGYQQYNYGGQGQYYGQQQQQQGYYQQAPSQGYQPSGFETVPGQSGGLPSQGGQAQGGQADDQPGAWGKPLKKKEGK